MSHPFVHVELSAHDRKEAARFYSEVFGWEMKEFPEMNYTTFETDTGSVGGGFNPVSDENPAGTVMVYVHTDDLEATLAKVEKNGGKIILPGLDIPDVGRMATFSDPTGNKVSLLKPSGNM